MNKSFTPIQPDIQSFRNERWKKEDEEEEEKEYVSTER